MKIRNSAFLLVLCFSGLRANESKEQHWQNVKVVNADIQQKKLAKAKELKRAIEDGNFGQMRVVFDQFASQQAIELFSIPDESGRSALDELVGRYVPRKNELLYGGMSLDIRLAYDDKNA